MDACTCLFRKFFFNFKWSEILVGVKILLMSQLIDMYLIFTSNLVISRCVFNMLGIFCKVKVKYSLQSLPSLYAINIIIFVVSLEITGVGRCMFSRDFIKFLINKIVFWEFFWENNIQFSMKIYPWLVLIFITYWEVMALFALLCM